MCVIVVLLSGTLIFTITLRQSTHNLGQVVRHTVFLHLIQTNCLAKNRLINKVKKIVKQNDLTNFIYLLAILDLHYCSYSYKHKQLIRLSVLDKTWLIRPPFALPKNKLSVKMEVFCDCNAFLKKIWKL